MATERSNESTTNELDYAKLIYYPIVVPVLMVLCLLGVLANLYILISIRWLRHSPSPLMVLTLSLAAADGTVALFNLIALVLNSLLPYVLNFSIFLTQVGWCVQLTMEAFRMGVMVTAIWHLLVIALTHYAGSLRPLHYQLTLTKPLMIAFLVGLWILPTFSFLLSFVAIPGMQIQEF